MAARTESDGRSQVGPRRSDGVKRALFGTICVTVLVLVGAVLLEVTARWIGLGQPVLYYNDAWGGKRPLPDQQVTRLGDARITVDANGFRSARPPAPGALRVLFLGDSVTWGGTSISDSLVFSEVAADVLRARGRPVYAMNAGVNGTALVNHAELLTRHLDEADAVVWLFPWSDTRRSYATVGPLWPARFTPRFALVDAIDNLIFRYWLTALREVDRSSDPFSIPDAPRGRRDFMQRVHEARVARNLAALRAGADEARIRGIPLLVGVTPYRDGDKLLPLPGVAADVRRDLVAKQVQVLDVQDALGAAPERVEALFLDHVHFSVQGHRVVGELVGQALADRL